MVEIHAIDVGLLKVGGTILTIGLFSNAFQQHFLSEISLALLIGVAVGPTGADLVHAGGDVPGRLLEVASEITLAVGLMAVALHTPGPRFRVQWRALLVMLAVVMPLMGATTAVLLVVILGLPVSLAVLIGAILSPTDPVVANAIVTGNLAEHVVPARIRHLISAESGANDGLAFPFVMLPILLIGHSSEWALWTWLTRDVLWNVVGAIIFGIAIGLLTGVLFRWSSSRKSIDEVTRSAYPSALAFVALGLSSLAQSDSLLAVYVAGLAFNFTVQQQETPEDAYAHHLLDRLLTLPIFILFGTYLPFDAWLDLGVAGIVTVVAILGLRRMPAVLLLRRSIAPLRDVRDALFVGWFGPIGVAAMFYAVLALREAGREDAWIISSLVITGSIVVHGLTATPFTRLYAAWSPSRDTLREERRPTPSSVPSGDAGKGLHQRRPVPLRPWSSHRRR